MSRWRARLRHDWPLHFALLATSWLPDNVVCMRLRGFLARPFLGSCGADLRLARHVSFYNPAKIRVGAHVYLGYGVAFIAGQQPITIADEVIVGPYCVFASNDHRRKNRSFRYGSRFSAAIVVERGVWLAAHVVVTAGSSIGEGSMIGAGAVVTGSIPADVVAAGIPAEVIKTVTDE